MQLRVTHAFGGYAVGDSIIDPTAIAQILNSDLASFTVSIGTDQMSNVATGTITGTGPTTALPAFGNINVSVGQAQGQTTDVAALFAVERSFDNGANWFRLTKGGTPITLSNVFSEAFSESEPGTLYRLNCLKFTGGNAVFRISRP
jgi:hypothetical protein